MSPRAEALVAEVLGLQDEERREVFERLAELLPLDEDDAAWEEELQRREEDLETGRVKAMSWEEVQRFVLGDDDAQRNN